MILEEFHGFLIIVQFTIPSDYFDNLWTTDTRHRAGGIIQRDNVL